MSEHELQRIRLVEDSGSARIPARTREYGHALLVAWSRAFIRNANKRSKTTRLIEQFKGDIATRSADRKNKHGGIRDVEHLRGVLLGYAQSDLGHRYGWTQVVHSAKGEERSGTGVRDYRRGRRTRAALCQGVRSAPCYSGAVGHQQPQQRGDRRDGAVGGVEEVPPFQPQVYTYVVDVGKRENVYSIAEKVRREVGEVDLLINNAGVVSGHHLLECPDELIERTMVVNCHAHFWTTKAFLPKMLEMNHGHIVTVASSLGLFSTAGVEDYCASKFGAIGFHESLSHEIQASEKDGIKMTLVCPYLVDAGMFRGCRIRKEIEPFLPPLRPEFCVKQATRAILTDQPMICMPRIVYMVNFMKSILPFEAIVCMYRFLGADKCMYPFLAQRKEAMNNNEAKNGI
ncbi:hypothetical protein DNTS_021892 [Danionella cerebrum]|uniref:NADP-retinol dehydrogenase n=1 Tax=Danionella cerebrum TaxID=2873325 RepID=A0A553QK85_9TELE|nr:hypothetical protein DNTS_021892 [Danionella translucida]